MSEETKNEQTQETEQPAAEDQGARMFTQEDVNRIVRDRLAKDRERTKPERQSQAEADLQSYKNEASAKIEAYTAQINDLTSEVASYKNELARIEVARNHDLPQALASRLSGNTVEELEADAVRLINEVDSFGKAKYAKPSPALSHEPSDGYKKTNGLRELAESLFDN